LAFLYFYPEEPLPELLKYVDAIDRGAFDSVSDSRAVNAFLKAHHDTNAFTFEVYLSRPELIPLFVQIGAAILEDEQRVLSQQIHDTIQRWRTHVGTVLFMHVPNFSLLSSIGMNLVKAEGDDFACAVMTYPGQRPGTTAIALRSRPGALNVDAVAKGLNAGQGHPAAAGMQKFECFLNVDGSKYDSNMPPAQLMDPEFNDSRFNPEVVALLEKAVVKYMNSASEHALIPAN